MTMPGSNQRWCSDKMTIACWNGEIVELVFALDCCDREAMAVVAESRPIDGADIYRVLRVEKLAHDLDLSAPEGSTDFVAGLEKLSTRLADCDELEPLLETRVRAA